MDYQRNRYQKNPFENLVLILVTHLLFDEVIFRSIKFWVILQVQKHSFAILPVSWLDDRYD